MPTDERLEELARAALAAARYVVPTATYRLQMHAGFTLRDAAAATDYLDALGVSHSYTSSLLAAKAGSTHGYDVADPERLNPELGSYDDLTGWVADLHSRQMGLLLDIVPNHMSAGPDNAWWQDVLEHGPASPFATYFDIAWQDHPRQQMRGKVLLPVLGDPFAHVLEGGGFAPGFLNGGFYLELYGRPLPIDPRTYHLLLAPAVESAAAALGLDAPAVAELQSVVTSVRNLPPRDDATRATEGRAEAQVVKRRLAVLADQQPQVFEHVARVLTRLSGIPGDPASFAPLEELIDAQPYRASYWRVAADEINYRRFFDINDLAALSAEREEVFAATHRLVLRWLADGTADGLRIDHPDGLFDPKEYLGRLQTHSLLAHARRLLEAEPERFGGLTWAEAEPLLKERFAEPGRCLYVVVEKILGHGEQVPDDWPTAGTTGYDFLAAVNGLFVDPAAEPVMNGVYERFTGLDDKYDEVVYRNKQLILRAALSSELQMLAHQLDRLAQMERWSRDFTLNGLRLALREVIACFPVYRTYIVDGVSAVERSHVLRAVMRARRRNPTLGRRIFDFVRDTLLLKDPPSGPATPEYQSAQRQFAGKFEQVTAPVTAKGIEDTTFYVFNRLVSLNEVGGEPGRFGTPPAELHAYLSDRAARHPGALSVLSTHDTKRGEDVRTRISVLAEMPVEWERAAHRWAKANTGLMTTLEDGVVAPDANEEYLLYQTLVGAWPGRANLDGFADRVSAYMNKAIHEAKVHTSWVNPDAEYDAAVERFVRAVLDPEQSATFLDDLGGFAERVAHVAAFHSLAQTLVRCAAPGVPDTYQGSELWELSLVDPDNRRPVDYARRREMLADLDQRQDRQALCRELVEQKADGRVKLYTIARVLRLQRERPDLFAGSYIPVEISGQHAANLFAFLRTSDAGSVLVVVPRLVSGMLPTAVAVPLGRVWQDSALELSEPARGVGWENLFTGVRHAAAVRLPVADVLADFPVALLISR